MGEISHRYHRRAKKKIFLACGLAGGRRGFWFASSVDWLEVVVDSVTSGSTNGSSLPGLRGTLSRQILRWWCWLPGFAQCAERCSGCGGAIRHGCRTGVRLLTSMVR